MRLTLLKCCYAIEIGAHLAYVGHYKVTDDKEIRRISNEELRHMVMISAVLSAYGTVPNRLMNTVMYCVGKSVQLACRVTPKAGLALVAGMLEKMNIVSYRYMAEKFPRFEHEFIEMQRNEAEHEQYFLGKK